MLSLDVGQPVGPIEKARKAAEENKAIKGALKAFSALRLWAVPLGAACPPPTSSTSSILPQLMSSSQTLLNSENSPSNMLPLHGHFSLGLLHAASLILANIYVPLASWSC